MRADFSKRERSPYACKALVRASEASGPSAWPFADRAPAARPASIDAFFRKRLRGDCFEFKCPSYTIAIAQQERMPLLYEICCSLRRSVLPYCTRRAIRETRWGRAGRQQRVAYAESRLIIADQCLGG